jgi:hypothetical protein
MKNILILLGIVLVLTGSIIAYLQFNKQHEDLHSTEAAFTLEAKELFAAFSTNEQQANEKFLNEVVEVHGVIKKMESKGGSTQVFLASDDLLFGIICEMAPDEEMPTLKVGDPVTIRGVCSGFLMDVALNRCVVIN